MTPLSRDQIISATKDIKGGTIVRITYKTELPLKAEFKKQGYKITKIVEQSVRFGVNYHNISKVIERKANTEPKEQTPRTNNCEWVIKDRIKYNKNTDKEYLVVANLPEHSNARVKYILEGSIVGTIDMGDEIVPNYKNIVRDSYFTPSMTGGEVKTISLNNIITINGIGEKINF